MTWKRGSRLKLVSEAEASPPIRAIFNEVRHSLGVPTVPILYQAYATVPKFLELHWEALQPALRTRAFLRMGERLAAEAYTRAQNYFAIPDLRALREPELDEHSEIASLLDALLYYQYLDPLLVLITTAQMQAFDGVVGSADQQVEHASPSSIAYAPELAAWERAGAALQRIWEERRRTLDLAFVPDEHRAAAMWPGIYQRCWTALKDLIASPLYADCQYRIGESAWGVVRDLPVPVETEISRLLEAGLSGEEISVVARVNESLFAAFTGMLLDVTFMRIACEGGSHTEGRGYRPEAKQRERAGIRAA
ncbi:MAG: halocarboxylic acid dehydrogenase DehI family protein [Candidatus Korobacteraceae bacterium]